MSDLRQAAQQALESLELLHRNLNRGMSKSIQKLVARENQEFVDKLKTALAQQVRQPLDERKAWDIAADFFDADAQYDGVIAFVRAIEAAHGIGEEQC